MDSELKNRNNRTAIISSVAACLCLAVAAILTEFGHGLPGEFGQEAGQFVSRTVNLIFIAVSIPLLLLGPTLCLTGTDWNQRFIRLGLALAANFALVQGIKKISWFPRPFDVGGFHWGHATHSGFPSGHTAPAFVLAMLVAQARPQWGKWWFMVATLIAWSRVEVHAHYAWQVTVSAVLGCVLGVLVCRVTGVVEKNEIV